MKNQLGVCLVLIASSIHLAHAAEADKNPDPLNLVGSVKTVPQSNIPARDITSSSPSKETTIKAQTALHYISHETKGDKTTYKLFTTGATCASWWQNKITGCEAEVGKDSDVANKTFEVSADDMLGKMRTSHWTTGVLVVPYKYGLANHSLSNSSVTLGAFAGYTVDWLGSNWTFPFVAGISNVSVPSVQNGAATSVNKAGLSIATGLMFKPGGLITTGVLFGVDQLGANSGYKDNGKVWLGVYVGAGFDESSK